MLQPYHNEQSCEEVTAMKIFEVLKTRKYGSIALISAMAMVIVYPYLQVALNGGLFNYGFWFEIILSQSVLNFFLYLAFSALFGLVVSLSIYNWQTRTCSVKGSIGSGGVGGVIGIFTSQCSACISLASLFLPTAAVGALAVYSTAFNFVSIGFLVLAIYLMGGFRRI